MFVQVDSNLKFLNSFISSHNTTCFGVHCTNYIDYIQIVIKILLYFFHKKTIKTIDKVIDCCLIRQPR